QLLVRHVPVRMAILLLVGEALWTTMPVAAVELEEVLLVIGSHVAVQRLVVVARQSDVVLPALRRIVDVSDLQVRIVVLLSQVHLAGKHPLQRLLALSLFDLGNSRNGGNILASRQSVDE